MTSLFINHLRSGTVPALHVPRPRMLLHGADRQATKAEIGFEVFPRDPCATEAGRLLRSLEGVIQVHFDPAVQRLAVLFDPARVTIPLILSTLEPLGLKPKLVSVITPLKGALNGENSNLR